MKNINILFGIIITILIVAALASYFIINNSDDKEIKVVGSTTVQPVAQSLAMEYMKKHPDVTITVQGGDSIVGIQSAQSGRADIGTASVNLTNEESQGLTQYKIGTDGIAIITNPNNPVNSLSTSQLQGIYNGEITNWNQVGGKNEPIQVISREVGSGTRLSFEDIVSGNKTNPNNATVAISTYQVTQDVAVTPNAIGYVSRNSLNPDVKLLMINNIPLTNENVANGEYTLQRPLYFLVKGTATGIIKDFIDFTLSPEGQAIVNNTEYKSSPSSTTLIGPSGGI